MFLLKEEVATIVTCITKNLQNVHGQHGGKFLQSKGTDVEGILGAIMFFGGFI